MKIRRTAALALVSLLAACGGDNGGLTDLDDLAEGAFEATFAGAVDASFAGAAAFSSVPDEGFLLSMIGDAGAYQIYVYHVGAGRPGTGTLQVGAASDNGGPTGVFAVGFTGTTNIFSNSGTLQITSSATGRLEGTLSFAGEDLEGGAVTGTAKFRATCFAVVAGICG